MCSCKNNFGREKEVGKGKDKEKKSMGQRPAWPLGKRKTETIGIHWSGSGATKICAMGTAERAEVEKKKRRRNEREFAGRW